MTRSLTATEAKAKFLALLDDVEAGEEIEITRRGVTIASLVPKRRRPRDSKGTLAGIARTNGTDEELFSTGLTWDLP